MPVKKKAVKKAPAKKAPAKKAPAKKAAVKKAPDKEKKKSELKNPIDEYLDKLAEKQDKAKEAELKNNTGAAKEEIKKNPIILCVSSGFHIYRQK